LGIGIAESLISLGTNGVALRTDSGRVLIVGAEQMSSAADISIQAVDSPDPVTVGGTVTYALTLRNDGPWTAFGVVLTSTLPSGVNFVSASASQGQCAHSNDVVNCALGAIGIGGTANISIVGSPTVVGVATNRWLIAHNAIDPNPANNAVELVATFIPVSASPSRMPRCWKAMIIPR
jgi:uncharacterized repeat protein (TIGR01451 family)